MKPTLFNLWNGNLKPIDDFLKDNKETRNLENLIDKNCEILISKFDNEQIKRFKIYTECINEYIRISNEEAFNYGIQLAFKIINDAVN